MAFHFDPYDKSLVVDGFENGIADSPFNGISDMRNVNIVSVPGEASVNFATTKVSAPAFTNVSVTSADAGADTITFTSTPTLETGQAVVFTGASLPAGIVAGTIYWVLKTSNTTAQLYTSYAFSAVLNITGTGTGTFSTVNMNKPKHYTKDTSRNTYWMVDQLGQVWSNTNLTSSNYWTFTGNRVPGSSFTNGNGIGYYQASSGIGFIFVLHNSSIDYTRSEGTLVSWNYQWNPTTGTLVGYSATPTQRLNSALGTSTIHETLVGQDNVFYYCDGNYVGSFFEKVDGPPSTIIFNPLDTATYTWNKAALALPKIDTAQCLAELGINLMIGGIRNAIYPWDRVSTSFNYPILLAEFNVAKMITVNTNTFVFAGNRGRVYITNGSNAQLYKKVPDHISGTVEPYYTWGGVASNKNQLYFSMSVTTNGQVAIAQYGGLWAIDLDTKAIRLVNKFSYGTYLGYASAIIANTEIVSGTGFFAGWDDGASGYGMDTSSASPYTGSEATIDSDLIPIGTFDKARDFTRVEYRLTKPMVSGESVVLKYRLDFSQSYTTIITDSTAGNFSLSGNVNFKNAQWLQLQAVINSTASSPSYTRLKEFRIKGLVE